MIFLRPISSGQFGAFLSAWNYCLRHLLFFEYGVALFLVAQYNFMHSKLLARINSLSSFAMIRTLDVSPA
jgi:hypothetical protein